ncbi:MAG: hypothetical protein D6800_04575, partial [Candidatus Zixiibacteriota bacterium]
AQGLYLLVRQTPVQETGLARKPANWLVVGRPWRPLPREWLTLTEESWDGIICARIDQYLGSDSTDVRDSPDLALPDNVIDLRKHGLAELVITGEEVRLLP